MMDISIIHTETRLLSLSGDFWFLLKFFPKIDSDKKSVSKSSNLSVDRLACQRKNHNDLTPEN
jgi:hypothetical protein